MKAGILTFHRAKNYGAVLQTFALLTTLKKLGINSCIINRYAGPKTIIHGAYFTLRPKHILFRLSWIFFDEFSKRHLIPLTNKYSTTRSLKHFENNENIEIVIVGSDQVWRMEYSSIGYNYFLDFIKDDNIKKISYAASFGREKWEENESVTTRVRQLLSEFNSVSVREKSGVKICADIFKVQAKNVLDPTLLLNKEDYEDIILKDYRVKKSYALVSYILGNHEALKYCNQFAKINNLTYSDLYHIYPFSGFFSMPDFGVKHYFHISVPEWLQQINNTKYFVTNSFHATIFAILFHKQFIVVDHPSGGTDRITNLLELLGLQDRFISNISEISLELFQKPIDWNLVNEKITIEKEKSMLFLQNSLS